MLNNTKQTICNIKTWKPFKRNYYYARTKHFSENKLYIYKYILNNPGVHLRQIHKELGLAMGNIQYHLNLLEKESLIKYKIIGNRKHYYSVAISGERNELLLALVRQITIRKIITRLVEHPGSNQQDLAKFMNLSAPTIKWHINRLIEAKFVIYIKKGKKINYYVKDITALTSILKDHFPILRSSLIKKQ